MFAKGQARAPVLHSIGVPIFNHIAFGAAATGV